MGRLGLVGWLGWGWGWGACVCVWACGRAGLCGWVGRGVCSCVCV
jgi:hypothetical protein